MTKPITVRTHADLLALMELTSGRRPTDSLLVQGMTGHGTELGPSLRLDLPQYVEDENTVRAFALFVVDTITTGGPLDRLMVALYSEDVDRFGGLTDAVTEAVNSEGIDLFRLFHCTPAARRTIVPDLGVWSMWSEVTGSTAGITARVEHGAAERDPVSAPAYEGPTVQGARIGRAARSLTAPPNADEDHEDVQAARSLLADLLAAETIDAEAAARFAAYTERAALRDWLMADAFGGTRGQDLATAWALLMEGQTRPDWERVDAAEAVILQALKLTPASHRAGLFAVLATFAWAKGAGTDAAAWADLARQADPTHELARLVAKACDSGTVLRVAQNRATAYRRG
ncbi:DUF4192 family protein [Tersicoccus sp. Bi-70]|uniref:DUF4192 family protein n=1 Tax=Tersicoccus sp. Bi-70 TaxID=1897634 RepID=UPI000976DD0D|nr:DUF4192 family protein [Tersicoccus sp. Bi-70]OMH32976.1 hypothetical protein BGP79_05250 [Tersicoccus sp. Bi-70]